MNGNRLQMKLASIVTVLGLSASPGLTSNGEVRMIGVRRDMLCVTEGAVQEMPGERLSVNTSKMRAVLNRATLQTIAAHFTYLGPAHDQAKLGSGESRMQFGFKLHSQDACNVVYAMWRLAPESKLVVSVKSNPGQHTSAECGNHGYQNIRPAQVSPVPALRPRDRHWFRAEMRGDRLRVLVDDAVVWDGRVGREAVELNGPVGMRSDNVRLEMELQVGESPGPQPHHVVGCESTAEQE